MKGLFRNLGERQRERERDRDRDRDRDTGISESDRRIARPDI